MNNDEFKKIFIEKASLKHNNKFDYTFVEYINNSTPVTIICPIHGKFKIRPSVHLISNFGCQECAKDTKFSKKRINEKEYFINKSNAKYNHKFDYSLVKYVNNNTPVIIICPIHGEFKQQPFVHLDGKYGCQECAKEKSVINSVKTKFGGLKSIEYFIKKSKEKHCDKYDYSLITNDNINTRTIVSIKCKNGHIFNQNFKDHMSGHGCPYCAKVCTDTESFIKLANEKHGDKYDYSKVVYKTQKDKVIIICPKHGEFKQNPSNHTFLGRGCPHCNTSKGEDKIKNVLIKNNIDFTQQKTFSDCKNIYVLSFDFYIPNHNMCIEFDGIQHFKPIKRFGGENAFKLNQKNDNIKNEYCLKNNIRLVRIKYYDDVEKILSNVFKL